MAPLTAEQVIKENQGQDASSIKSLKLNLRAISDVSFLSVFSNLEQLDVGCNNISSLEGLGSCVSLKNLSVAQNKLTSLNGIQSLSKLAVLNAGQNMIVSMTEVASLTNLRALIMNDNKISSIPKLESLKFLNTLVLSKNPVANIGKSLEKMKSITKLSVSNCQIQEIGSSIASCVELKEARFAHNEITTLPNELSQNARLQVLDLGKNAISSWSDLRVLSSLQGLKNLNLQGNPVTEINNFLKKVKKMLPRLKTFNAKPLDEKKGNKATDNDMPSFDKGIAALVKPIDEKPMKRKSSAFDTNADQVVSGTEIKVSKGEKKKKLQKLEENVTDRVIATTDKSDGSPFASAELNAKADSKAQKKDKKPKKANKDSKEFDDGETSFMELMITDSLHDEDTEDTVAADKGQQAMRMAAHGEEAFLGGLVINPMKGRKKKDKKSLNAVKGRSALELLQSVSVVGMGGPSTWD